MDKINKLLIDTSLSLTILGLIGCSGTAVGLNDFKPVTPTEQFSKLDPSHYSTADSGELVKELILKYQRYGGLFVDVERESPTVKNTCYELEDKVKVVKPLLHDQNDLLVDIQSLYNKLETLKEGDPPVAKAVEAGKVYVTKASQRVQKHIELMDIMISLAGDCPGPLIVLLPVFYGIPKYISARGKAPEFNKTASELEELSAQEKRLASNVSKSLIDLRPRTTEEVKE